MEVWVATEQNPAAPVCPPVLCTHLKAPSTLKIGWGSSKKEWGFLNASKLPGLTEFLPRVLRTVWKEVVHVCS